eukprot:10601736-Alexandrium_andersonii.AAC.1
MTLGCTQRFIGMKLPMVDCTHTSPSSVGSAWILSCRGTTEPPKEGPRCIRTTSTWVAWG